MEMKELFESTFYKKVPEVFYVIGDCCTLYVIAKTRKCNLFSLYVFEADRKERMLLKSDGFDELMEVENAHIFVQYGVL
ncbi:MAG: hypothetical protein NC395_07090 [Prevotella sp.]|nr:hypothetical protein [Prevotella sp.]